MNSALLLFDGAIIGTANKTLLPNYDVFDEYRYFQPADYFSTFTFKGVRIALTICEDMWNVGNENPPGVSWSSNFAKLLLKLEFP